MRTEDDSIDALIEAIHDTIERRVASEAREGADSERARDEKDRTVGKGLVPPRRLPATHSIDRDLAR